MPRTYARKGLTSGAREREKAEAVAAGRRQLRAAIEFLEGLASGSEAEVATALAIIALGIKSTRSYVQKHGALTGVVRTNRVSGRVSKKVKK